MTPAYGATMIASILPVRPADRMRLSAQADIAIPRQRMCRMLEGLSKRRAAVSALTGKAGPHVEVSVNVDDGYRPGIGYIAEIVPISRLVSAAQNHGHRALG